MTLKQKSIKSTRLIKIMSKDKVFAIIDKHKLGSNSDNFNLGSLLKFPLLLPNAMSVIIFKLSFLDFCPSPILQYLIDCLFLFERKSMLTTILPFSFTLLISNPYINLLKASSC